MPGTSTERMKTCMKRQIAFLLAVLLLLPCFALAEETEEVDLDAAEEGVFAPLPIDFSIGHVAPEDRYTEDSYQDASITVTMEKQKTDEAVINIARVRIADPSQLRTAVTSKGRTNKISTMARKANAILAIGGEYFSSDEGGLIVRMGKVQQGRKSPYKTRDLLAIDSKGDFHILIRSKTNKEFNSQLKTLTESYELVNVFDFGPALIVDGAKCELPADYSFNLTHREPRCAIGQTGELEYVLVVIDSFKRDGKSGFTGEELAQLMLDLGCTQAYNLDGGNSCLMVFHGQNYSDKSFDAERSVSDIIYFATAVDFGLDPVE